MDPKTIDSMAESNTWRFMSSVATFGSGVSQVLYNFASLESSLDESICELIGNLNATIQTLNQLCNLSTLERLCMNYDALKYVETLTEETSVSIARITSIIGHDVAYGLTYLPTYWKSLVSTDDNGHKVLAEQTLDEVALFQQLTNRKPSMTSELFDPSQRLEELQLLLLLVFQVVTVRNMMNKL